MPTSHFDILSTKDLQEQDTIQLTPIIVDPNTEESLIGQFLADAIVALKARGLSLMLLMRCETLGDGVFAALGCIGRQQRSLLPFTACVHTFEMDPKGYRYASAGLDLDGFCFGIDDWASLCLLYCRSIWILGQTDPFTSSDIRRVVSHLESTAEVAPMRYDAWIHADNFGYRFLLQGSEDVLSALVACSRCAKKE